MSFKKDTSKVRSFSAGAIKKTGFYSCTITKAYDRDSLSSDAKAIHLDLVTDSGQYASIDLWHTAGTGLQTDKNGRDLPAIQSINDLMVLLDINELTAKRGLVNIYDFDARQDVEAKRSVYPALFNQSIGCVFQMVESAKQVNVDGKWQDAYNGERICRPEFLVFCDAETKANAAEFLSQVEPVAIDKYIASLEPIKNSQKALDAHIIKQAQNQPNAPVSDAITTTLMAGLVGAALEAATHQEDSECIADNDDINDDYDDDIAF